MYTIMMNTDGTLVCTTPSDILYQTESLVDNIHFVLPKTYKDVELKDFTIYLKYVNPANINKIEILTLSNDNYKENYLEYKLPITTDVTKLAGKIKLYLTMIKVETDEVNTTKYISHSAETYMEIVPVANYFTDEESLSAIDRRIVQIETTAAMYDKNKADGIAITENDEIYLTSGGEKIGESITVKGGGLVDLIDQEGFRTITF